MRCVILRISAIIPAFNEEGRIEGVLDTIVTANIFSQIIVVDDGSTDNTSQIAGRYPIELIALPYNKGKAEAVKQGLSACNGEIIVLLDADLIGLTKEHILHLVKPIQNKETEMTIGIFKGGRLLTDMAQKIAPNLSGQRAFNSYLAEEIIMMDTSGYSIEVALKKLIRKRGIKTKWVILQNISHVTKEEKLGFLKGTQWRFKMYRDIIKYWFN
ncbi:glycosyltransferase family 2 protein [Alkaliphilus pronyensis]|uniref:Glucosyl-3-phosphoglycerate synthase n=1 Tax=Alkaliphilus pronyensis TaxID=1482732 RepID=A0A6I0FD26_9FIRM|nr:glycosyltransferase family 2 protein [Alkaliphilus pronyensis]KAB3536939.1 glycosyltransferase family 2 protein [Alkaliphilus pronyensis]